MSSLNSDFVFNDNQIITITGITKNPIFTLGTIRTNLIISEQLIPQVFHVANDDFNIPASGILGKDFLKNNRCKIDYKDFRITVNLRNNVSKIPIYHGSGDYTCIIPHRTISNLQNITEPMFVKSQEISGGVFISKF